MPFNFNDYRAWCYGQDPLLLQKEFERYTRETMAGSAGTSVAIGLAPLTFGLSALFGAAAGGAKIANATKKLSIIENELNRQGIDAKLRKRDFLAGWGVGATVGALTHGAGGHLVDSAVHHAVNHTANQAAGHVVNQAAQQTVQHSTSTGDYLLKAAEHGADKLAEKGGDALEEYAYGEKVVGCTWRDLWDSDSEDSDDPDEARSEDSDSSGDYHVEYDAGWSDSDDD